MKIDVDSIDNRQSAIGNHRWTLLLDAQPRPGWANMALDQSLLDDAERTGEGFVRLYRWAPWCLSFGRNEPALRRYDRDRIRERGLDTVRRPTGGRAVWHARELTYAVAAPLARFGGANSGPAAYCAIHRVLAEAVRGLGAPAELAPERRAAGVGAGACFALAVGGEVTIGGRKLAGSAQLLQGPALLQHGSLLLEDDQSLVADITAGMAPPAGEITLGGALGRTVTFEEAADAVAQAFSGRWNGTWSEGATGAEQLERHADRFRDPAWTWRR